MNDYNLPRDIKRWVTHQSKISHDGYQGLPSWSMNSRDIPGSSVFDNSLGVVFDAGMLWILPELQDGDWRCDDHPKVVPSGMSRTVRGKYTKRQLEYDSTEILRLGIFLNMTEENILNRSYIGLSENWTKLATHSSPFDPLINHHVSLFQNIIRKSNIASWKIPHLRWVFQFFQLQRL